MCNKYYKLIFIILLTTIISACTSVTPPLVIPNKPPKPLKLKHTPRVVLVLGAGGARGYAHIGVLKVLHDAGVPIDMIVGASAGSLIGALYADSLDPNRVKDIMFNAGFWDFADLNPGIQGTIQGYRVQRFLLRNMHAQKFNQLKIPLIVATTDLKTGEVYAISNGLIPPAVGASGAIPGIVKPAYLYGKILVDGGVSDPIPVELAKIYKPKIIIAVDVTKSLPYLVSTSAYSIYDRSYQIIWSRLSQMSERDADIQIRPDVGQAGTFDFRDKQQFYHAGEIAAQKALPKLLNLLAKVDHKGRSN